MPSSFAKVVEELSIRCNQKGAGAAGRIKDADIGRMLRLSITEIIAKSFVRDVSCKRVGGVIARGFFTLVDVDRDLEQPGRFGCALSRGQPPKVALIEPSREF